MTSADKMNTVGPSASCDWRRISPAVGFAMIFPFVLTLIYFVLLAGQETGLQNMVFGALKVVQFGFPAFYVFFILRESLSLPVSKQPAWRMSIGFGAAVFLAVIGIYFGLLKGTASYDVLQTKVLEKVQGFGLNSVGGYSAFALFYCIVHSALEEYYWRWFVFKRLRDPLGPWPAIIMSSVAFMAHHVVLMVVFFGIASPLAWFFSICVAVGGGMWAWLYQRSDHLIAIWVCHAMVDAALFFVGYDLIFN